MRSKHAWKMLWLHVSIKWPLFVLFKGSLGLFEVHSSRIDFIRYSWCFRPGQGWSWWNFFDKILIIIISCSFYSFLLRLLIPNIHLWRIYLISTLFTNLLIRWTSYHSICLWSLIMSLFPSETSLISKWRWLTITWACDSSKNYFSAALLTSIFLLMLVAEAILTRRWLFHVAILLCIAILDIDSTTFEGLLFIRRWRYWRAECRAWTAARV